MNTKAFVDTTILCDILLSTSATKSKAASDALANFKFTEAPEYGLKELRAGPLSAWILAHNILAANKTIEEAVEQLGRRTAFKPRQNSVGTSAILMAILQTLYKIQTTPRPSDYDVKTELENYLARRIFTGWHKRRSVVNNVVQPLSCFVDSELELDDRQIRFPSNSSECAKGACCGAAIELKQIPSEIEKVVAALRPPKKQDASEKRETTRRRGALKEVLDKAPKDFPRKDCRALGDAYFCLMAPVDSEILTTNRSDFEPIAQALGKKLKIV